MVDDWDINVSVRQELVKKFVDLRRIGFNSNGGVVHLKGTIIFVKTKDSSEKLVASINVLFVGTKRQAQNVIKEEAERAGVFYVANRWLGGTLTNFTTIRKGIWKLIDLEEREKKGEFDSLQKKERTRLLKEKEKIARNLEGLKGLEDLPSAIYIIDSVKEKICVNEARRMGIPTIAIVDTNGDPDKVTYPIPGNDDAIRSIKFITSCIANAVIEGRNIKEGIGMSQESGVRRKKKFRNLSFP
ncbi:MAG: 30S ribosomal protein S2, partial [bacterium]